MKKIMATLLAVVLLLGLGTVSVSALSVEDYNAMKSEAHYADYFYDGLTVGYVVMEVSSNFVNEEDEMYNKETHSQRYSSEPVEMFMADRFVLSDAMFQQVREELGYNADGDYYDIPFMGGFGGFMAARELVGYKKNADNSYSFYYQTKNYEPIPEEALEPYKKEDNWPDEIVYGGKTYVNGIDGYVCDLGFKDGGLVHTLEVNNHVPRFLSTKAYTDKDKPAKFDAVPTKATTTTTTTAKPTTTTTTTKPASTTTTGTAGTTTTTTTTVAEPTETVAQTEGLVLKTAEDVFPEDAVVTVEKVVESAPVYQTVQTALKPIAKKFVAYEISAKKNNVAVQPDGTVTAEFDIPADFDPAKVVVLYVADDGTVETLTSTVDAASGKVKAVLTHFSTYVIAEKVADTPDTENDAQVPTIGADDEKGGTPWVLIIVIAVVVLLAGGAAAWYFLVYKKQK